MIIVKCSSCGVNNRIKPHDRNLNPVCGRCGNAISDSLQKSVHGKSDCLICNDICINGEILVNGTVYHDRCYTKLRDEEEKFTFKIRDNDYQISYTDSQIAKANSIIYLFTRWLPGKKIDAFSLQNNLKV